MVISVLEEGWVISVLGGTESKHGLISMNKDIFVWDEGVRMGCFCLGGRGVSSSSHCISVMFNRQILQRRTSWNRMMDTHGCLGKEEPGRLNDKRRG